MKRVWKNIVAVSARCSAKTCSKALPPLVDRVPVGRELRPGGGAIVAAIMMIIMTMMRKRMRTTMMTMKAKPIVVAETEAVPPAVEMDSLVG